VTAVARKNARTAGIMALLVAAMLGLAFASVPPTVILVVGLQGRFAEAETIAKGDLPADEATANVAYLREMLSRKDKDNSRPPGNKATVPVAALNRPD